MTNIELAQALAFANRLVHFELQRVVVGPSTGSIVGLYFGLAQSLVETSPWYVGLSCSWRVEGAEGLLACSSDDNAAGGPMQAGLEELRGQVVASVAIVPPGFDLVVNFERGQRLIGFADNLEEARLCWYISDSEERVVSVEPAGRLCYEAPAPGVAEPSAPQSLG